MILAVCAYVDASMHVVASRLGWLDPIRHRVFARKRSDRR